MIDEENIAWMDLIWSIQKLAKIVAKAFDIDYDDI